MRNLFILFAVLAMRIPLIGPSNTAFSVAAAAQQSINVYTEPLPIGEKNGAVLRGAPGWHLLKDLRTIDAAAYPVRGFFAGGGRLFVAAGTKYFEISNAGALIGAVHTIADDADHSPVTMIPNGNQLLIVSAGIVYCDSGSGPVTIAGGLQSGLVETINTAVVWKSGDKFHAGMVGQTITIGGTPYTVAAVTSPTLLMLTASAGAFVSLPYSCTPLFRGETGTFIDGYFVVNQPGSRQFNISRLLDGTTWGGLDFGIKEGWPDNIVRVFADNQILYLFGAETTEMWRNTGNASFPFERVDGGMLRVGLAARWSPVSIMGKLYFLGSTHDGNVCAYRMDGANVTPVSTPAVEQALSSDATEKIESRIGYAYQENGHWFWVLNFDGATNAWVYDVTASQQFGEPQWHQRKSWDAVRSLYQPYPFWTHAFIPEWGGNGEHIVGDRSGILYVMSSSFYDENGGNMRGQRTMAVVYNEGKRVFHHRIDIENEAGLVSGAGDPPVLELDWSDDRGHTFGTGAGVGTKMTLNTGAAGEYSTRAYAVALGSSRWRNYRLTITGQTKIALIDASLDATPGVV